MDRILGPHEGEEIELSWGELKEQVGARSRKEGVVCLAGKQQEDARETMNNEIPNGRISDLGNIKPQVSQIWVADSVEFSNPPGRPKGEFRSEREKVIPGSRERAPRKLDGKIMINLNRREDLQGFFLEETVYKEVTVPGSLAQSSSTVIEDSKGSNTGITLPGPVDSKTSLKTPRSLLALA